MEQNRIKFEEDYIFRNCRSITTSPDLALTELVANAWDAGAQVVKICLPEADNTESKIIVEDDGNGMSDDEFKERWLTLNYNRTKHQGELVEFPEGVQAKKRIAYGRNGIGRHGMLCFSDNYIVETWRNNKGNSYSISVSSGAEPFKVVDQHEIEEKGHGTRLSAFAKRNVPNIKNMRDILAGRFIYDPQFKVYVNGKKLDLLSCDNFYKDEFVETINGKKLHILIIDSTKTALKSQQHGVAFWVSGRLVGTPSWSYGKYQFLDARFKIAKRYTLIVQSEDIIGDVLPDWTGFLDTYTMDCVYKKVKEVVDELVQDVMQEQIEDIRSEVIESSKAQLQELRISEKREVSTFIEEITNQNPTMSPDLLKVSVEALLSIQKSKRGEELLRQISNMTGSEIDKLTDLLKDWDINDIVNVIDEIDKRILVVEAIERVCEDKTTDELHTLHPMVLNAKWLFGPEFDSPMFESNKSLNTVIKGLFKDDEYDASCIANPRKRPDIVCLNRSTMRAVCTDRVDSDAGGIMKPDQILIIELKRGGYEIGAEEVMQAENYVRQIKKSGILHKTSSIHAFVVGNSIGDIDSQKNSESGRIDVVTYGQLVQTASIKLFGLKKRLEEHYKAFDDESLIERALQEPEQMKLKI